MQTIAIPLRTLSAVGQRGQRQEKYREILPRDAFRSEFSAEGLNRFEAVLCESLSGQCMYKQTGMGFFK